MMQTYYRSTWTVLSLAAALAVSVMALAALAGKPADAAAFETVTKNFDQPDSIKIPGDFFSGVGKANPYPSTRNVGGFPEGARITDVNLILRGFTHSSPEEVDIMLAHGTVNRTVMSDAGGFQNMGSFATIVLDDEAPSALPKDGPLVAGKYRPINYDGVEDPNDTLDDHFEEPSPTQDVRSRLSGFDDKNPEGPWRLFVDDQFGSSKGTIADGYSLRITARFPTG